jgi:hypothetical protein
MVGFQENGSKPERAGLIATTKAIFGRWRITQFKFWWTIFTAMLSSMSVISLIQKWLSVGIKPILLQFLTFYRRLLYPLFDALASVFHVSFADWYKDLFFLSFIFSMAWVRVNINEFHKNVAMGLLSLTMIEAAVPPPWMLILLFGFSNLMGTLFAVVLGASLIGLLLPLFEFRSLRDRSEAPTGGYAIPVPLTSRELAQSYALNLASILVVSVLFFAVNAFT